MDAEIKRKWVEALRSGDVMQGDGYMLNKDTGSMCCLGVLAHIQGAALDKWTHDARQTVVLPSDYRAGLTIEAMRDLARKNDGLVEGEPGRRWSFSEIADYIEEHL